MKPEAWERTGAGLTAGAIGAMLVAVPAAYATGIYEYSLLPKELVLHLSLALAAAGWGLQAVGRRRLTVSSSPVQLALLCFAGIALLGSWQTTHPLDTTVELFDLLSYVTLFLVAAHGLPDDRIRFVLCCNAVGLAAISIVGILQYHDLAFTSIPSNGQPSATFGYRNFAAMYLVCAVPLGLLQAIRSERPVGQLLSGMATSLGLIYLAYTRTRGAWGGLGVALLVSGVAILANPALRTAWRERLMAAVRGRRGVATAACLAVLLGMVPLQARFEGSGRQRFDEKKADLASTVTSVFQPHGDRGRTRMWYNTGKLIWNHLLTGVGAGGWKREYPPYDRGAMIREHSSPRRPHNDYLWIAAEFGVPGLAAYTLFLAFVLLTLWRLARNGPTVWAIAGPCVAAAILATLGHAVFSFPRERPQAAMYLYLLAGIAAGAAFGGRRKAVPVALSVPLLLLAIGLASGAVCLDGCRIRFDRHYVASLMAEDRGDWDTALYQAREALANGTFRPHAFVIQGRGLELKRRYDDAEASYREALGYAPYSWHALNGMGVAAKRRGDLKAAADYYRRALDIYPASIAVRNNLGALYRASGDTARAESLYRAVLSADPAHVGANNNLGNIYKKRGQLDSAAACYRRALRTDRDAPQAHYNLADVYRIRGEFGEAAVHYRMAAARMPGEPRVYWAMGLTLEALGDTVGAEEAYRRVASMGDEVPQASYNLGNLLFLSGRYQEAEAAYQAFLSRWKEDDPYARFARGRLAVCREEQEKRERGRAP